MAVDGDPGREHRRQLIAAIENARHSTVICYVTGDRQNLETQVSHDAHPLLFRHLRELKPAGRVDLFLYTPGGNTVAGWALVRLIREFCTEFSVLVPYRAWSCGTLICLGADEIVMSRLGQLGPIDPSTNSPFNPPLPGPMPRTLPVNVEDVAAFIDLAKNEIGLVDQAQLVAILQELGKISPCAALALGAVHRVRPQIAMLARGLLQLHMSEQEKDAVDRIVDALAREQASHDYIIGPTEAHESFGLKVSPADEEVEALLWDLYVEYESLLELSTPYNAETLLAQAGGDELTATLSRAVVESRAGCHKYQTVRTIRRVIIGPPQVPIPTPGMQQLDIRESWTQTDWGIVQEEVSSDDAEHD